MCLSAHLLAVITNAAVNMFVHGFCVDICFLLGVELVVPDLMVTGYLQLYPWLFFLGSLV